MSKEDYKVVANVPASECKKLLDNYHYLAKIGNKGFRSGFNVGLYHYDTLVGVCIFTSFPVPELSVGMLGISRQDQDGLFELSRLCLDACIQGYEHNIASWFVSRSIKLLRKETNVRCILSYADSDYHSGIVYRACNFDYYGLSEAKKDFWIKNEDGSFIKHNRGKTKGIDGEWRPRSRKHRYVLLFDKSLSIKWEKCLTSRQG